MSVKPLPARMAVLLIALYLPSASQAGIAGTEDESADSSARATRGGVAAAATTVDASVSHNKTIDVLLQLQDKARSNTESGSDKRKPDVQTQRAQAGQPTTTAAHGSGLFDDAAPIQAVKQAVKQAVSGAGLQRRTHITDESPRMAVESGEGGASTELPSGPLPGLGLAQRSDGPGFLSHPIIRFIRENRAIVIGSSIVLLAGIWLAAGFTTRARGH